MRGGRIARWFVTAGVVSAGSALGWFSASAVSWTQTTRAVAFGVLAALIVLLGGLFGLLCSPRKGGS